MQQLRGKYALSMDRSEGWMSGNAAATREIRTSCGRERRPDEWKCGSYEGKYAPPVDASEGQISEDAAAMREIRTLYGGERRLDEWRYGSYEGNTHDLWRRAKAG